MAVNGERFYNIVYVLDVLKIIKSESCSGSDVWLNDLLVGRFTWRDQVRSEAKAVLEDLKRHGFQLGIVSGDAQEAVDACAREIGWDLFDFRVGDCDPFAKQKFVTSVMEISCKRVLFVGDGINDALAQSASTLGISMNPYSASASSVTLLHPNLELIASVLKIGCRLRLGIVLNLLAASIYNLFMIPWAVGAGLPFGLPLLSPRITSLLMVLSGLTLVSTSLLTLIFP